MLTKLYCTYKACITSATYTHLLKMAYDEAECTWVQINYGKSIIQFQPDIKTSTRWLQWIKLKICWQKTSILFNQICLNEEILPNYTDIYIYMCVCVWVSVCVCLYMCVCVLLMCVCVCVCVWRSSLPTYTASMFI